MHGKGVTVCVLPSRRHLFLVLSQQVTSSPQTGSYARILCQHLGCYFWWQVCGSRLKSWILITRTDEPKHYDQRVQSAVRQPHYTAGCDALCCDITSLKCSATYDTVALLSRLFSFNTLSCGFHVSMPHNTEFSAYYAAVLSNIHVIRKILSPSQSKAWTHQEVTLWSSFLWNRWRWQQLGERTGSMLTNLVHMSAVYSTNTFLSIHPVFTEILSFLFWCLTVCRICLWFVIGQCFEVKHIYTASLQNNLALITHPSFKLALRSGALVNES